MCQLGIEPAEFIDGIERLPAISNRPKADISWIIENNIVKMRRLNALEIHRGTPTVLERGVHHIMLIGLKKPLREGELAPLTLVLERAGKIKIEAYIQAWAQSDEGEPPKDTSHQHGS